MPPQRLSEKVTIEKKNDKNTELQFWPNSEGVFNKSSRGIITEN